MFCSCVNNRFRNGILGNRCVYRKENYQIMAEVTLNVRVLGSQVNGGNFQLTGIPTEVWDAFLVQAKLLMPDLGDNAWAELLTSVVLSVLEEKERVILMNKIPDFVYEKAEGVCREAKSTLQELVKSILDSASHNEFYLGVVNQTKPDENTATVIFTGVPLETMAYWGKVAEQYREAYLRASGNPIQADAIDMLTLMMANAASNKVNADIKVTPQTETKSE